MICIWTIYFFLWKHRASSCHILLRYKIIVSFLFKNLLKKRNHAIKYTFLRMIINTRSRKWFVSELFIIFWWKHNALSCHLPLRYNILMWPQDRRLLSSLQLSSWFTLHWDHMTIDMAVIRGIRITVMANLTRFLCLKLHSV